MFFSKEFGKKIGYFSNQLARNPFVSFLERAFRRMTSLDFSTPSINTLHQDK